MNFIGALKASLEEGEENLESSSDLPPSPSPSQPVVESPSSSSRSASASASNSDVTVGGPLEGEQSGQGAQDQTLVRQGLQLIDEVAGRILEKAK